MEPNASDSFELILGRLALEQGMITADQLRESLSLQAQSAEIGLRSSLTEIFVKKGFASAEQVRGLERERLFHANKVRDEEAFGRDAVKAGLLDEEALAEALERIRIDPESPPLEELLANEDRIDGEQWDKIAAFRARRNEKASAELLRTLADACPPPTLVDDGRDRAESPPKSAGEAAKPGSRTAVDPERTVAPGNDDVLGTDGVRKKTSLPGLLTRADGLGLQYTEAGQPILGEYEVVRELGRGAMGVVYEAVQKSLNRRVALKVLPPDLVMNQKRVKRFRLEAEAAGRLDHPGIVKVFGMGEQGGIHYFAMEYIEGKTFEELVDQGNLPFRRVCKLVAQAAQALQYAHEQGVIHRDIKPANIMVQTDGKVRVMDFGLARQEATESSLTASGAVLGTPAYMSPEQAKADKGKVDRRTDIYALGATLYEMLTLTSPIEFGADEGVHKVLLRIMTEEPASPTQRNPKIPLNLSTVVMKAVAKEPRHRYDSISAFSDDLERFLRGDPVVARPVGKATKIFMKVKKHKALTAFLVLLVLTAALVPAIWIASRATAGGETAEAKLEEAEAALRAGELMKAQGLAEYVVRTFADRGAKTRAQRLLCETKLDAKEDLELFSAAARLYAFDGDGPDGRWGLARMLKRLVKEGRKTVALKLAARMVDRFPREKEGLQALSALTELQFEFGHWNEARRGYERLTEMGRGTGEIRKRLRRLQAITPDLEVKQNVRSVAVGDLDGDGKNEIAMGGKYDVRIYRKEGPTLKELHVLEVTDKRTGEVGAVRIGDADNDGLNELVLAYGLDFSKEPGALEVWEFEGFPGGPRKVWAHPLHNTRVWPKGLIIGDIDGDGRNEIGLAMTFYQRHVRFFRYRGRRYEPCGIWCYPNAKWRSDVFGLAVGHVGRPVPQIAAALSHWNGYAVVTLEKVPGTDGFINTSKYITGESLGVILSDLNGDGVCEIITGKEYTRNEVLFGPGKRMGELADEDLFVLRYRPHEMAKLGGFDCGPNTSATGLRDFDAGDIDGDGRNELIALYVPTMEGRDLALHLDVFRLQEGELDDELVREELLKIRFPTYPQYRFCTIADVDDDGKNEIILYSSGVKILGFD
ncbi:MAG: protein kinase domain-containing protein [Planctomycetota bacterium]|jgi:predicted Ser/Thr protein kinase/tetratricopeptide (TPR) repeat protein